MMAVRKKKRPSRSRLVRTARVKQELEKDSKLLEKIGTAVLNDPWARGLLGEFLIGFGEALKDDGGRTGGLKLDEISSRYGFQLLMDQKQKKTKRKKTTR